MFKQKERFYDALRTKKRLAHASQDKKKRTMGAHDESKEKHLVPAALSWKKTKCDDGELLANIINGVVFIFL